MTHTTKILRLLASVALLGAIIACGGSDDDQNNTGAAEQESLAEHSPAPAAGDECAAYAECCDDLEDVSGLEPLQAGCRNQPTDPDDCERRMRLMRSVASRNPALPSSCR